MFIWVVLNKNAKISTDIVDNYKDLFESRISAGRVEKLLFSEKSEANIFSWSYAVEGHAKKCVERISNLQTNRLDNYTRSQHHALTTVKTKKKKWDLLDICQKFAHILF